MTQPPTQYASTRNALKGMPTHIEQAEGIKFGQSAIDYLLLNCPPACNYACEKCFTWANADKIRDYLKTDEIIALVSQAAAMGAKVVGVIGEGEPMMYCRSLRHKVDYMKIIEHNHSLGLISLIATNGSLLDRELAHFCYEHNVSLAVSLDTLDADEYDSFYRGDADLGKLLENLDYARKLYRDAIYTKNGVRVHRLGAHMTVTSKNRKRTQEIIDYCGDDIFFDCDHIAKVGIANENPDIYGVGIEEEYDQCQRASRNATSPMVLTKTECGTEACSLFYYGLAVGYEGEVMVDTHAVETKYVVGHVRSAPLPDLLARAQSYRDVYFSQYGGHACIIRNPEYPRFLEYLEAERRDQGVRQNRRLPVYLQGAPR